MKRAVSFWQSLEAYGQQVAERSPLPYTWIGIGMVVIVVVASALNTKNSVVGARSIEAVVEKAARLGDYAIAQKLWNNQSSITNGQLEDLVYPERVVERRIRELEEKLGEYPENRDIYLMLAELYNQVNNMEKASEYREKARVLDPNDEMFR